MDIIRLVIIFGIQLVAVVILAVLLYSYIKKSKKGNLFFKIALFFYTLAGILNMVYIFINNTLLLTIFYSITTSSVIIAPLALFF
jgi:hypothetical protein